MKRSLHARVFALFVVLLVGLIGSGLTSCAEPQHPTIEATSTASTLVSGRTAQLSVTRKYPGGPLEVVTDRVSYSSSNREVATVSERGLVIAGAEPGTVNVRIHDGASDATTTVSFTVDAPTIQSIDVVPSPAVVMLPGQARRFTANARMNDGTTRDVTSQVLWASSNEATATVGRTPADLGLVTAVTVGETTVSATDAATLTQGRSIVFVTGEAAQLSAIIVSPNPGTIALGQTLQFTAAGVYADGMTKDVTKSVTWTSSKDAVATIDVNGLATGVIAGDLTITAAAPNTSVKGSAAAKVQ